MQRIDKNQSKPKRLNVTVSAEQFDYVAELVKHKLFDSGADFVRRLINREMETNLELYELTQKQTDYCRALAAKFNTKPEDVVSSILDAWIDKKEKLVVKK